jgi:hypothetical protein
VKKKKKGAKGNGLGPHAETSPMGHATRTKNKRAHVERADRKSRQLRWQEG